MIYSCKHVLTDFGVAKLDIEYAKTYNLLQPPINNTVIGSPNYMAPELLKVAKIGYTKDDPYYCDIFSFGLVILECCTL